MSIESSALLVMVHGSPMPTANADMLRVVDIIRQRGLFDIVTVGYMECNEPTIPDAILNCVESGATKVVAVPYFLHVGTHVADDLPTLIEGAETLFPNVEFSMGPYIGESPEISELLAQRIEEL